MSDQSNFEPVPKPDDFEQFPETAGAIEHIPAVVREAKSGVKTTEFWITIAVSVLTVLNGIPLPEKYEGAVVAFMGAVYALSRGLAKKGIPHVEPAVEA